LIEQYARPMFQKLVFDNLVYLINKHTKLTANQLTSASCTCGISVLPCLFFGLSWLALVLLWLSGLLDVLDGSVARAQKAKSPVGAMYDIVSDRIVEFFVIYGLYIVSPSDRANLCLLMIGAILICVTSFLVVGTLTENSSEKSFHYSSGLMERSEAFIFFSLMILFPSQFVLLSVGFIVLVCYTTIVRLYEFSTQAV
jgi:archaetidylinositol phosphate synthase